MNVLFLTIIKINSLSERGIYTDLLNKFNDEGHQIYVVSPFERRERKKTAITKDRKAVLLNIRTFNLQKTNAIEKGIGTLALEYQYLRGIKKYFSAIKFDLVIYSTPPITFSKVVAYLKKRDRAYAYLLLKDIFPQNAVDMKMIRKNGPLHKFFLKKENELYKVSDTIGCMSEANRKYLIDNSGVNRSKVEVNPNSITPAIHHQSESQKNVIRHKHKIPLGSIVFIYGGNLGIPQGVDFLLETIANNHNLENVFFLIVGSGTELNKIRKWFSINKPGNASLIESLPKTAFDELVSACDVGMIFLNKNFTIPNFPSRLLSYLEYSLPVLAATDTTTDIGTVIQNADCGYWLEWGDTHRMNDCIRKLSSSRNELKKMGANAFKLLTDNYTAENSYRLITEKVKNVPTIFNR